jgi:hypothetical protein
MEVHWLAGREDVDRAFNSLRPEESHTHTHTEEGVKLLDLTGYLDTYPKERAL